jgi:hypothetical protein
MTGESMFYPFKNRITSLAGGKHYINNELYYPVIQKPCLSSPARTYRAPGKDEFLFFQFIADNQHFYT